MKTTCNIPCGSQEACYGCTSCAVACPAQAIHMKSDENGFPVPVVDAAKCTRCGYCETVCPVRIHGAHDNYEQPLVYGVKNRNDEIRRDSSSGGAFYALAETVLGCYAGAAVYGCAYDEHIVARHERATDKDGLRRFMGSKYVQSDLGNIFEEVRRDLSERRSVLFSGTPCQISGLKAFLGKRYDNLFTVDIVCHGVMSPLIFKEHIQYVEKKKRKSVSGYYNRSKVLGWGRHVEEIVFSDGSRDFSSVLVQSYRTLFFSNNGLRSPCYSCRYSNLEREGDITLGDFWGIENVLPAFRDDLGVSLMLVNTEKGSGFWK